MWDEPFTRDNLKKILNGENEEGFLYYAAKILREARFEEVWDYLSPAFVASHWEKLRNIFNLLPGSLLSSLFPGRKGSLLTPIRH